jgi:hypothetical protein
LVTIKLLLLLYVAKGSSSLNLREKWTIPESNLSLARVNLTHTLGTFRDCSKATVCLSFRLVDQIHHKRLQDHTHIQCAGRTSVVWLHDRTLGCPATHIPTRQSEWPEKPNRSGGRYVHYSGRLVTRLTAYHISRHVASTLKRLTTATTHCDLNQIHQHRRGIILIHHINPIRHPYSDYRNVNIATPISREWQEITRLLLVLLA